MPKTKELLDTKDVSLAIESPFSLDQLAMKKDLIWHFRISMHRTLPKMYYQFQATLLVNEEPFERKIKALNERMEKLQPGLEGMDNGEKDEIKKEIKDLEDELEEIKDECPAFTFPVVVEEIKYKNRETLVTFRIPWETVAVINEQRENMVNYKVSLEPKL